MDNSMEGSDLLYAEDLEAGDRFLSPLNVGEVLIVSNQRTSTYRMCVGAESGIVSHVRWSTQVRRLSAAGEVS